MGNPSTTPEVESTDYLSTISRHDRKLIERYIPRLVSIELIKPSPENDEIYGAVSFENDPALNALVRSIERRGLEEPLILTQDYYILSGHRRFFAARELGWDQIPARFSDIRREDTADYRRLLAEHNPQRVKSVLATLSEKLLLNNDNGDFEPWERYRKARGKTRIVPVKVAGVKITKDVGDRQQEFLKKVQEVVEAMQAYWPISVRRVHYGLLNDKPLTQVTKDRNERWRYANNRGCSSKLSSLLVAARYHGHIPWEAIDDETRESVTRPGFSSTAEFIEQELGSFLTGYHRDRQEGQPHHIELIVEKNTVKNILSDIATELYVPMTSLKGYGGPSLWREIELRWRAKVESNTGTTKPKCILIIVSDHDPEGLNLADDAYRSLRDNHGVDVEMARPAVTMDQVRDLNLPSNPAKETSTRFKEYVRRTGTRECWEVEALEPEYLRKCVHAEILKAMDVNQLNAVQECEAAEKRSLKATRARLHTKVQEMLIEGGE